MPTEKQRREAARRHLERQLQRRQEQDARRKKLTLISSIVGTLVLIVVIIVAIVVIGGTDSSSNNAASKNGAGLGSTPTGTASTGITSSSAAPLSPASATPSVAYPPATGAAVTFKGVTVKGATDLKGYPVVTSKASTDPKALEARDLVVGKGKAATPTSTVTVQYSGVLYNNGLAFDSSWKRGMPAQFPLTRVVPGFTQGIGGTTGLAPMKVGGRRIVILPSTLGYGAQASGAIPANSSLVFVIDLVSVDS